MRNTRIYNLTGVDCPSCALKIEEAATRLEGVKSSQLNMVSGKFVVSLDAQGGPQFDSLLKSTVAKVDPNVKMRLFKESKGVWKTFYTLPLRVLTTIILILIARRIDSFPLYLLAYLISGYDVIFKALKNIFKGRLFDENFLMTIATVGAFLIGQHAEAVAVMAFYQIGEFFQTLAVHRSRTSIAALIDIKAVTATVVRNGQQITIPVEELRSGETFIVRAGEKVPVDGVVTQGSSHLDAKALTGESLPVSVTAGDAILSGSINGSGVLTVKASGTYEESTVAKILKLVEDSASRKTQRERFITSFARYYTPVVVALALLIALVPPLFSALPRATWLYRSLVFLVISCPCALVISVPLSFFAGIGALARMGILVKGSNFIQLLATTGSVIFDKTGTLTRGEFSYRGMSITQGSPFNEEELLRLAASLESHTTHPIGLAITGAYKGDLLPAEKVKERAGIGIEGFVDDHFIELSKGDGRDLNLRVDGHIEAQIRVVDKLKAEAATAVQALRALKVPQIALLSGDSARSVEEAASEATITEYYSRLMPQDKVDYVERFMDQKPHNSALLFVGDGINDAPVLARSDIGVSMGQLGSDAAIEASDVVIMQDNLLSLPTAIRSSRRTLKIVRQNIIFAIAVKVIIMALGALGYANMWMAVFGDTGVALLAVLNSLRAMKRL
ncbi:MAG: heavy metal translocating P-type ATPase [Sphaerochaetaceae bacterium]